MASSNDHHAGMDLSSWGKKLKTLVQEREQEQQEQNHNLIRYFDRPLQKKENTSFGSLMGHLQPLGTNHKVTGTNTILNHRYGYLSGLRGGILSQRTYSSSWDDIFLLQQLVDDKQRHAHPRAPIANKKFPRTSGNESHPDANKMKPLISTGLVDNSNQYGSHWKGDNDCSYSSWMLMTKRVIDYKQKHGHLKVTHAEDAKLKNWINKWRYKYRKFIRTNGKEGSLKRMKDLISIGLVHDITSGKKRSLSSFSDMFEQLEDYKQRHGHVRMTQLCKDDAKLGRWVAKWRVYYKKYRESNEKEQKDPEQKMKRIENSGMVDDLIKEYKNNAGKVVDPCTVTFSTASSSNLSGEDCSPDNSTSSTNKNEKKCFDNEVPSQTPNSDILGSELRGGFWA